MSGDVLSRNSLDGLADRLNDPKVADSLNLLLDNIDALAFLAMGLNGFLQRGDTIAESLSAGVTQIREASNGSLDGLGDQASDLLAMGKTLTENTAGLEAALGLLQPDIIAALKSTGEALAEGQAAAARSEPEITGALSALRALKDPDLQRGLNVLVHVGKALGRNTGA